MVMVTTTPYKNVIVHHLSSFRNRFVIDEKPFFMTKSIQNVDFNVHF